MAKENSSWWQRRSEIGMEPWAREALATADLVLCEDTRVTGLLLAGWT